MAPGGVARETARGTCRAGAPEGACAAGWRERVGVRRTGLARGGVRRTGLARSGA